MPCRGGFVEGIAYGDEALRLAEGIDRRYDRVVVPLQVGQLHLRQGNVSKAIPLLEQAQARTELSTAIDLYRAMDMTFWLPQTESVLTQAK